MRRTFYVLDGEDVIALLLGIVGHVVEGFALGEKYFQNVARLELREFDLGFDEGQGSAPS